MMKRISIIMLILVLLAFTMAGCQSAPAATNSSVPEETSASASASPEQSAQPAPEKDTLTIGLALSGINSNAIFIDMYNSIKKQTDAAGYKLLTADIIDDPNKIITAVENFISAGADVIILQNYAEDAAADVLKKAKDKGIIIGSYDYESKIADYAIIASNYEVGKAIGRECGKWVKEKYGKGKVAIANYPDYEFLQVREKGMRDGFAEACPEGEIAIALKAGYPNEGVTAGENFLQAVPDLVAVMGINDGGTLGVYEAFKAAGKSKSDGIAIFGCDASVDGLNAIKEDNMFVATIDLDLTNQITQLYKRCVETALTGKFDEANKLVTYPVNPIYLSNIGDLAK